ncbi:MAG: undecaprenyl-diphosphatase UppP [Candidatus Peregrinibacteria bacterium]
MNFVDSLLLGILQGITEFLPISSSGHLVLGEQLLGLNVGTLKSFDVALHFGTLFAIIVYFRKDVWEMLKALGRMFLGRFSKSDPYAKLILFIIIGTIPAVIAGVLGEEWIDSVFRHAKIVAVCMIAVGVIYLLGEAVYRRRGNLGMKWYKAIVTGLAQAVALVPGVSRSGSTIVAGLFQGVERSEAARFSFLLGIPAIFGAGVLTALKIPANGGLGVELLPLITGFISSFIFGLLSVAFLMRFLKKNSLLVFAIYLVAVGVIVFV